MNAAKPRLEHDSRPALSLEGGEDATVASAHIEELDDHTVANDDATVGGTRVAVTICDEIRQSRTNLVGKTFDKYLVLDVLGHGGMATVYRALDPVLERECALKIVQKPSSGVVSTQDASALQEGRALARLSHPNVVPVYEVGTYDGYGYIAMELVRGFTLKDHLANESHSYRQVLRMFRLAGEGLVAAHAKGLVHSDFKPENVMVHRDGRVMVTDFGVAVHARSGFGDFQGGTPAYMAPELFDTERDVTVDARCDQYAFCVALYRALYGRWPANSKRGGTDSHVDVSAIAIRTPAWVRAAVERGLSTKPEDRFPDMVSLLRALDERPRQKRRRLAATGLAGTFALAGGVAYGHALDAERQMCATPDAMVEGIWDANTRTRLREAFTTADATFGASTWPRVERRVERMVQAWRGEREEACLATHLYKTQSEARLDARMVCLDGYLREVDNLVDVLADANRDVVLHALEATDAVTPLGQCENPVSLQATQVPEPGQQREDVQAIRDDLARARVLFATSQVQSARDLAKAAVDRARQVSFPPVAAEASFEAGRLALADGELDSAEALLLDAVWTAEASHADATAARARSELLALKGHAGRFEEAKSWKRASAAAVTRAHDTALLRFHHEAASAMLSMILGDYGAAVTDGAAAVDHAEEAYGAEHWQTLAARMNHVIAVSEVDPPKALEDALDVLATAQAALGPDHLLTAAVHETLAWELGDRLLPYAADRPEAQEHLERALEIREAIVGPDHLELAGNLNLLSALAGRAGQGDKAFTLAQRAHKIRAEKLEPRHFKLFYSHVNMARGLYASGKLDDAMNHLDQAIAISEKHHGQKHPDLDSALFIVGRIHQAAERHAEAAMTYAKIVERSDAAESDRPKSRYVQLARLGRAEAAAQLAYDNAAELAQQACTAFKELESTGFAIRSDIQQRLARLSPRCSE